MIKQVIRAARLVVTAALSVAMLLPAVQTQAFTFFGAGTSSNPYRIATCAELKEIDTDLSAYYTIVRDIDCSGSTFLHLADTNPFTGTLDGKNHKISNINIDSHGLFNLTTSATIKNLMITSGTINNAAASSFVYIATATEMYNLHSSMSITSSGSYSGGLVGTMNGPSTLYNSSYSGTFTSGPSYNGGLVGLINNATAAVFDSFVSGTIVSNGSYVGGIGGSFPYGTVTNVYSAANFDVNGQSYNAGLFGRAAGWGYNLFSANTMTNHGVLTAGVSGLNLGGTFTNTFMDAYLSGTTECRGQSTSVPCTKVNEGNVAPNYFKNNSTNGPFPQWDFNTIWETTSSYPTLRTLKAFTSPSLPNNGDANGDSIQDLMQSSVLSVLGEDGLYTTIEIPTSASCTIDDGASVNAKASKKDTGYTAQKSSMTGFSLYCKTNEPVPVTLIFDKVYNNTGAVLRFFNQTSKTYTTVSGAVFGTRTVGGTQKSTVTYTLTDGGVYDEDGVENGIIKDPVGVSTPLPGAPDTGVTQSRTNTLLVYSALFIGLVAMYIARKKFFKNVQ